MILCSITAVLLGVISYASYQEAFTHPYGEFNLPYYTVIISVLALVCGLPSGILFLKEKVYRYGNPSYGSSDNVRIIIAFLYQVYWLFKLVARSICVGFRI